MKYISVNTTVCCLSIPILILLVGNFSPVFAQVRKVTRENILLLSTRSDVNIRYVCDGSVSPPRVGLFRSQTRSVTSYTNAPRGSRTTKATRECLQKVLQRACGDTIDNDNDGTIDFPEDQSCTSLLGSSEGVPNAAPTSTATPVPIIPAPPPPEPTGTAVFRAPFNTTFSTANFFDHDVAREFIDANGYSRISSGETLIDNLDGHQGYDFSLPEGTTIVAAGDGEVEYAGTETPFSCPLLNKTVSGLFVRIRHTTSEGTYFSVYVHLSRIDVKAGQVVSSGTPLGLSGNTGCSTGPHLHFDIRRPTSDNRMVSVDPFGWSGSDSDPWTLDALGLPSTYLWKPNQAPEMYRQLSLSPNPNTGDRAPVAITTVRSMSFNDDQNPNNEFIEFTLDPRYAGASSLDLSGYYILNNNGDRFDIPQGTSITLSSPLVIRAGTGVSSSQLLYQNRSSGMWNNDGDCVRLFRKSGTRMYYLYYGNKGCAGVAGISSAFRTSQHVGCLVAPDS